MNTNLFSLTVVLFLAFTACTKKADDAAVAAGRFTQFQNASLVIGQPDFVSGTLGTSPSATSLEYASGVAATSSRLFINDKLQYRVVAYNTMPTTDGQAADFALGQTNLTSGASGTGASQFVGNIGVSTDGTRLLVADENNNRVQIWSTLPTANTAADIVLGHTATSGAGSGACAADKLNGPNGAFITPAGKVIVANASHNRVHIWNSISTLTTGAVADVILGDSGCVNATGAAAMDYPVSVWSDDSKLAVVDLSNNRVLIWNTFPTVSGTAADVVVGQPNFTTSTAGSTASTLSQPWSVASDGTELYVSDAANNRILIWRTFPTANGTAADAVLGQDSLTAVTENDDDQDGNASNPSARTLYYPAGIFYHGNKLYVADRGNYRVLVFSR